jgi:hypothetical protein
VSTCTPGVPRACHGDLIDVCTDSGTLLTLRCEATCDANGRSYTGVCDDSFDGTPSDDGQDTCFCS